MPLRVSNNDSKTFFRVVPRNNSSASKDNKDNWSYKANGKPEICLCTILLPGEKRDGGNEKQDKETLLCHSSGSEATKRVRKPVQGSYWSVYSVLPTKICCFTNRTHSHSGPSTCINECLVLELMDLTSPVTRKVLRLWICSTEVQCQRVPVWSHIQREKVQQFIDGNAFYVLQSASGEGNRVRQAGGGWMAAVGAMGSVFW